MSLQEAAATVPPDIQSLMWQGLVCFGFVITAMAGSFAALVWFIIRRQDRVNETQRKEAEEQRRACREDSAQMRQEIEHLRQRQFDKDIKTMEVMSVVAGRLKDLRGAVLDRDDTPIPHDEHSDSDLHRAISEMHEPHPTDENRS